MTIQKQTHQLRSSRDLRSEILALAAEIASNSLQARLILLDPVLDKATVRSEWDRVQPALAPGVRSRLSLVIESTQPGESPRPRFPIESHHWTVDRPNYRFEVLRLLVAADLENDGPQPLKGLIQHIGASQTPIRQALADLREARVGHFWNPGVDVQAESLSSELLARTGALPASLRLRFARGAQIRSPQALLERALQLLGPQGPASWNAFSLSGVAVAQQQVPELDLVGLPRLDLVAHVPRTARDFDFSSLLLLDDGLELEPSVLAPVPLVITLVRADQRFDRAGPPDTPLEGVRCAPPADIFFSLLDQGLREQAVQYVKAMRIQ